MDQDQKLARLLRADAPPERDPHFRIALLERRTRQRYQRRQRVLIMGSIMLAVLGVLALKLASASDALEPAKLVRGAGMLLFVGAVMAAAVNSVRAVKRVFRQVRGH
jgi:hypothetical protein